MESTVCPVPTGTRLIETFCYRPGQGIARLELHLARLKRSARALGFEFDLAKVAEAINALSSEGPLRCRLTLGAGGDVEITTAALPSAAKEWAVRIAPEQLRSEDALLRHKTTRREVYDHWRAELPDGVQEWLFLNERGELCEGTITNVVLTMADGARLTPALASGCLPGVCRQSLLNAGLVQEAVLTVADVRSAQEITLTNALRGEIIAAWDGL
ncbi:aminotransferase class IV family protein [Shimia sagamensis]|uniref:Probable branched-chain-amino-acid aminotransferase n=1 Tax=Shimia sagamensis TaxID=1566352 RepID=A0ABY1NQJ6_9RHOB|nr:aminotransferase class IV family protein [Shimia sagamensis]SMP14785.1 4-amino-4-deoxychorismate lyase [Shimia sagamensis]